MSSVYAAGTLKDGVLLLPVGEIKVPIVDVDMDASSKKKQGVLLFLQSFLFTSLLKVVILVVEVVE